MKRIISVLLCIGLLLSCGMSAFAEEASEASSILSRMTLEQKIGQMLMPEFRTWNGKGVTEINDEIASAIKTYGFGGIILFGENTKSTAGTTELIYDMQTAAEIPMLISVDQEGGYITRLATGTTTPGNMALGATGDPAYAQQTGAIIGSELAAEGFNVDFAPDMDVNNNPSNPIIGIRSFSDSPELCAKMGVGYIQGLHSENVAAALKHFPGHGDTATDSHTGLPCINKSLAELESFELIPFQAGVNAETDVIMTAHIQYPQIEKAVYISKKDGKSITLPATLSKTIVTDILREKMGYTGVVCTDAMNMSAIAEHFDRMDAARLAINAGVDILLMPVVMSNSKGIADCGAYIQGIVQMVKKGEISESTIDAAVLRILSLKEKHGILNGSSLSKDEQVALAKKIVGSKENHEIEWEIAKRAVTLVKDEEMVPLCSGKLDKVVLFCSYSDEINSMNYAISLLRQEGKLPSTAEFPVFCYNSLTSLTEEQKAAVQEADAVIASVESYRAANITGGWQASFLDGLIAFAHENETKVAILSTQLPYDVARYQKADALLLAYGCKGMDEIPTEFDGETPTFGLNLPAAVYTVFGGNMPAGKLPVDIPKLDESYNYTSEILYPRGYGISFFRDVATDAYYFNAVRWAQENDVINGVGEGLFAPNNNCTRAQFVTILYRMEGEPASDNSNIFTDVPSDSYFEKAVIWASGADIVNGVGEGRFAPNALLTREMQVTMLCRYAAYKGDKLPEVSEDGGLTRFNDAEEVSAWAYDAMCWAVGAGIVKGDDMGNLLPLKPVTRAQTVTMLYRMETE